MTTPHFPARARSARTGRRLGLVGVLTLTALSLPNLASADLAASKFEIDTNANLIVDVTDPAGNLDWATVTQTRKGDEPSGANDDAFGNGSKEDTAVPSVIDGSIPPNKSDLKNFGLYLETTTTGARFLHLYWHRVQDPSGTTNMDFEFNKSETISANGVTPVRTSGDVLIQYDLANGGTNPQLFLSEWLDADDTGACEASNNTPCWGEKENLSAQNLAKGSINTSAISAANADGLGAISARTFGEATIDFDVLASRAGDGCASFGSVYLKSRSSDSFSSALKDFIAPSTTNLDNCGSITVVKRTTNGTGAFDFTSSTLDPAAFTLTTTATGAAGQDSELFADLSPGAYDVAETVPAGWSLATPTCSDGSAVTAIGVAAGEDVTCTFVNTRQMGALEIFKQRKHAASGAGWHDFANVSFTITGGELPAAGSVVQTNAQGRYCVLLPVSSLAGVGNYTVVETLPTGYANDSSLGGLTRSGLVVTESTCAAPSVTAHFRNIPLTNVTVSVDSQVPGGTASTIDCTPLDPTGNDASTGTTGDTAGDGSLTLTDRQPGTYVCEVVIDP